MQQLISKFGVKMPSSGKDNVENTPPNDKQERRVSFARIPTLEKLEKEGDVKEEEMKKEAEGEEKEEEMVFQNMEDDDEVVEDSEGEEPPAVREEGKDDLTAVCSKFSKMLPNFRLVSVDHTRWGPYCRSRRGRGRRTIKSSQRTEVHCDLQIA